MRYRLTSIYRILFIVCIISGVNLHLTADKTIRDFPLIPMPQEIEFSNQELVLPSNLQINRITDSLFKPEGYHLSISNNGINIRAGDEKGYYWGLATLEHLSKRDTIGNIILPACEITDYAAFPYRGLMIDCGRSYLSIDKLKRIIQEMSRMKLNVFHWHLTENQAWRLESKLYPQLNDSVNMIRDKGKFYSFEDIREIRDWASKHNVIIIPEIDMPGHSAAFTQTFGFDMQSPEGMKILKDLIGEACDLFDEEEYFHIGTDEVKFTNSDFVNEMVGFLRKKGKKVISWNPGYKYKPEEIDVLQLWSYRGAPIDSVPYIDSRFHYINHFDTYADMRALYRSNIYGHQSATDSALGAEIALWNDRYVDDEDDILTQNNLYPYMMVLAERTWKGGGTEYFDSLGTNMGIPGSEDFLNFEDFETRMLNYKDAYLSDLKIPYVKQTNVKWRITDPFPNGGDLSKIFPPETEGMKKSYLYEGENYNTSPAYGAGIYLKHAWKDIMPSFYKNPEPNHTAYAFTRVYSPCRQEAGLQFETQNYSRSEPDLPPPTGKWDYRESRLWINGEEIEPPIWTSTHSEKDNEISLGNENMVVREPIKIHLKEGWNDVIIKLPVREFSTPEIRLVKWMFTFVFTTPDGKQALPGLIYDNE